MITMAGITVVGLVISLLKIWAEVAAQVKFEKETRGMPSYADMQRQIAEADAAKALWIAKENAKRAATTSKEWKNA